MERSPMVNVYILTDPDFAKVDKFKVGITEKDHDGLIEQYLRYLPEAIILFFESSSNARDVEIQVQEELKDYRIKNSRGSNSEWYRCPIATIRRVVKKQLSDVRSASISVAAKEVTKDLAFSKEKLKTTEGAKQFIKELNKILKDTIPEDQHHIYWGKGKIKRYDVLWKNLCILVESGSPDKPLTQKWTKEVCSKVGVRLSLV